MIEFLRDCTLIVKCLFVDPFVFWLPGKSYGDQDGAPTSDVGCQRLWSFRVGAWFLCSQSCNTGGVVSVA